MKAPSESRLPRSASAGCTRRSTCRCDRWAVAFTAAQAFATAGSGAVSIYTARGPVSQSVVIGTPKSVTATKTVRVRVKGKVVTRKVSFTYQTVTPLMSCGEVHRMRYGLPAADDPARRVHRLAYASGADVRRGRTGRGNPLPRDVGLPVVQVRDRRRLHAASDRSPQHEERGFDAAGPVGLLCASAGDGQRGDPH